jgi:hypothetical protein
VPITFREGNTVPAVTTPDNVARAHGWATPGRTDSRATTATSRPPGAG